MFELNQIDTIFLDGDGVLWKSTEPIPGIQPFIEFLNQNKIRWALLTNNNSKTVDHYVNKLKEYGVTADPTQILTSSTTTVDYLKKKYGPNAPVHVVGGPGLIGTIQKGGFRVYTGEEYPPEPVSAVVAGMDFEISHNKIKVAMRLILGGAEFIATNTDGSFPTPDGLSPGTGMVVAAIQATTNVEPTVMGKPQKAIFLNALERFGALPETTLMVGDRLNTDILGAKNVNIHTAAVLTGVSTLEEIEQSPVKPDLIFKDIQALHRALSDHKSVG